MKKSDAVKLVNNAFYVIQKARSNIQEATNNANTNNYPGISDSINEDCFSLLFGEKGKKWVLAFQKMANKGEDLEPIDIYNLAFYAHELEPVVGILSGTLGFEIPEPSLNLLHWDKE